MPGNDSSSVIRLTAVLLILPCIYLGWLAVNWGIADRHAYDAAHIMKRWKEDQQIAREPLETTLIETERAVALAPDHPDYRDQLARLLIYQSILDRQPHLLGEAKQHLLHSRTVRPGWPTNWALFIEVKHRLDEIDADFAAAIVNATHYGPWSPEVLQTISRFGVVNFAALPDEAKTAVIGNIARGLRSPVGAMPNRIVQLVEQQAEGWTVPFARRVITVLVDAPWQRRAYTAKTKLGLRLWPLFNDTQRDILTVNIVAATVDSPGNSLIKLIKQSGKLAVMCPRLPREKRFQRYCNDKTLLNP